VGPGGNAALHRRRRRRAGLSGLASIVALSTSRFAERLNTQTGSDFAAHQQVVAIAVHHDGLTMPVVATYSYQQGLEERDHALMDGPGCSWTPITR
jgi:hypothetical protein